MTKKKKLAIISGVLLFVAIAAALIIVLTVFMTGMPAPTNLQVILVTESPDYQVTVSWDAVEDAVQYAVEYKYELREDEIYGEVSTIPQLTIDRVRGELSFRVKAYGDGDKDISEYSEWYTYEISALTLDLPSEVEIVYSYDGSSDSYGYTMSEDSRNSWENVEYTYSGGTGYIQWYEIVKVPPEYTFESQLVNAEVVSFATFTSSWYWNLGAGEWNFYIRAINYGEYMGEKEYYSIYLYELYDVDDEWRQINFEVVDRG